MFLSNLHKSRDTNLLLDMKGYNIETWARPVQHPLPNVESS